MPRTSISRLTGYSFVGKSNGHHFSFCWQIWLRHIRRCNRNKTGIQWWDLTFFIITGYMIVMLKNVKSHHWIPVLFLLHRFTLSVLKLTFWSWSTNIPFRNQSPCFVRCNGHSLGKQRQCRWTKCHSLHIRQRRRLQQGIAVDSSFKS